jgi:threonine dehydratase
MRALYEHAGLVVEPSAALGVAAVVEHQQRFAGRRITTILCGSNVAAADFAQWVLGAMRTSAHRPTVPLVGAIWALSPRRPIGLPSRLQAP